MASSAFAGDFFSAFPGDRTPPLPHAPTSLNLPWGQADCFAIKVCDLTIGREIN